MTNAYAPSYESHLSGAFGGEPVADDVEEVWYPASLQYGSTQLIQLRSFHRWKNSLKMEQKRTVPIRV